MLSQDDARSAHAESAAYIMYAVHMAAGTTEVQRQEQHAWQSVVEDTSKLLDTTFSSRSSMFTAAVLPVPSG